MFKHTILSTSATSAYALTSCQPLAICKSKDDGPTGDTRVGDQVMAVDVVSTAGASSGTLGFVLYDPNTGVKMRIVEATITATAQRSDAAGTGSGSAGYVCSVVFPDGTNKIDLIGHGFFVQVVDISGNPSGNSPLPLQWYVGASALGTLGTITVGLSSTRQI